MWYQTSTLDDDLNDSAPVRQLRKPPSQRNAGSPPPPPPLYQQDDAGAEGDDMHTTSLDGFGWGILWWFVGYLLYGAAGFKIWIIITLALVIITPVYLIGSALVCACFYILLFK